MSSHPVGLALLVLVVSAAPRAPVPASHEPPPAPPAAPNTGSIADLAFMSGAWRCDFRGSVREEHFSRPTAGTIVGMFRWMRDGATSMTEHMVLEQRDDGVHFLLRHFNAAIVPWGPEKGDPFDHRLVEVTQGRAVFEAPERVFPARVVYHRSAPDTLVARLEGRTEQGEERIMEFMVKLATFLDLDGNPIKLTQSLAQ